MGGLYGRFGLPLLRGIILALARLFLFLCYRVRYEGFESTPSRSPYVMVANHVSFLDGLVLQCAVKRPLRFVIDYEIYHRPFVHVFMKLHRAIPVLPRSRTVERAMDEVSAALRRNEAVMIFPEGRLTVSGHLGRFKPGAERIVERDPVPVYPVAIKGLWGSVFSRKYRRSRFPILPRFRRLEVRVICGKPLQPPEATVQGMQRAVLELLRESDRAPGEGGSVGGAKGRHGGGRGDPFGPVRSDGGSNGSARGDAFGSVRSDGVGHGAARGDPLGPVRSDGVGHGVARGDPFGPVRSDIPYPAHGGAAFVRHEERGECGLLEAFRSDRPGVPLGSVGFGGVNASPVVMSPSRGGRDELPETSRSSAGLWDVLQCAAGSSTADASLRRTSTESGGRESERDVFRSSDVVSPGAGGAWPPALSAAAKKCRDFAANLQQIINKRAEKG